MIIVYIYIFTVNTHAFFRYVFWYHEKRMVNYDGTETPTNSLGGGDNKRGLVSVETITPKTIMKLPLPSSRSSKRPFDAETNKIQHFTTKSTLTIKNATPKDAGNYTCKPSNAIEASIQVFVSEGDKIRQYYLTKFITENYINTYFILFVISQ